MRLKKFPDKLSVPASRKEALAQGGMFYFTGKGCPHGHTSVRRTSDGSCVECMREHRLKSYHRVMEATFAANDVERIAEIRRIGNDANKKYYADNKEKKKISSERWRRENREYAAKLSAEWFATHPGKRIEYKKNRRARKSGAEGKFTCEDISRIRKSQKDKCACCGIKMNGKGSVDHIVALSKGGTNWPSNIQLLCGPCNSSKHARDPIEFMQSRGFLL